MSIGVYLSLGASKIDVPLCEVQNHGTFKKKQKNNNLRKETFVLFFGDLRARTGSKTHPVSTNCSWFLFTSRLTRQKEPQHDI